MRYLITLQRSGASQPFRMRIGNLATAEKFLQAFAYSLRRDRGGWVTLSEGDQELARYPRVAEKAVAA